MPPLRPILRAALGLAFLLPPWPCSAALAQGDGPQLFGFDHEGVLGTSAHFEVRVLNEQVAARVDQNVLGEIERLRKVLSAYDADSELRKLAPTPEPVAASPDLRAVLAACEHWMEASGGALHPGVQVLSELWEKAAERGSAPSDAELAAALARLPKHMWRIDGASGTVLALSDVPATLDALAKGYVIDRACEVAVSPMVLVIGGDLRAVNGASTFIAVADPRAPADNSAPLCRLRIKDAGVATSGGYARGFDIDGVHYSHILDPRNGRPVGKVLQATVVAPDAMTADALATALNVLAPDEGLTLAARTPGVECLIVDAAGAQHASAGWAALLAPRVSDPKLGSALPGGGQLVVDFEIAKPSADTGGDRRSGWRRPYVAAWIENERGEAVRTLCLWVERPRWISDLRRWTKQYGERMESVETVTRATRNAGKYQLVWDGRDDEGGDVTPGRYSVLIEAVREHGGYQLVQQEVTLDGQDFRRELAGGGELAGATISFRKAQAAK